jgi:hypothetical protein
MSSTNIFFRHRRRAAAGAAAVALSGVLAACGSSATTATTTANTAAPAPTATAGARGTPPAGLGRPVTGAAAAKAEAAALAKYAGTVERVVQLPDGSYEVHVVPKSGGEIHVRVSEAFEVTGTETGPPAPPAGAGAPAPSGTASQS